MELHAHPPGPKNDGSLAYSRSGAFSGTPHVVIRVSISIQRYIEIHRGNPWRTAGLEDYLLSASCLMELNSFAQRHASKFEDVGPFSPRHAPRNARGGLNWTAAGSRRAMGVETLVRRASAEDAREINLVLEASYSVMLKGSYDPEALEAFLPHVVTAEAELLASGSFFLAICEGQAVACGGWSLRSAEGEQEEGCGHLRQFAVHPSWAGRGAAVVLSERTYTILDVLKSQYRVVIGDDLVAREK